jgi:hypothetical protein
MGKDGCFVRLRQASGARVGAQITTTTLLWGEGHSLRLNWGVLGNGSEAELRLLVLDPANSGRPVPGFAATLRRGGSGGGGGGGEEEEAVFPDARMAKLAGREVWLGLTLSGGSVLYSIRGDFRTPQQVSGARHIDVTNGDGDPAAKQLKTGEASVTAAVGRARAAAAGGGGGP